MIGISGAINTISFRMALVFIIVILAVREVWETRGEGTPPMVCQVGRAEVVYKLPSLLNCTKRHYEAWTIQLEKKNMKEFVSKAKGLLVVDRTCKTETSFFNVKTADKTKTYVDLTQDRAVELMEQESCINGKGVIVTTNGKQDYSCRWAWMETVTSTEVHCSYFEGLIYAKHGGIARTDLASFRGCDYNRGFCKTGNFMYITWEKAEEVTHDYEVVGNFSAVKIGSHLLIEKLGLALEIGNGSKADVWVDREFRVTKWAEEKGKSLSSSEDSIAALRDEVNNRFEYLLELIKSPKAKAEYLCDIWNQLRKGERMLAMIDPTSYIREKTGRRLVTAMRAGDYVLAFPCLEVEVLDWAREEGKCYNALSVRYRIPGDVKVHKGYMTPKHNIIETSGVEVDCHRRQPEVTEVGGRLEWHSAHSKEVLQVNTSGAIDLTLRLNEGVGMIDFLKADWVYDAADLRDTQVDRLAIEEAMQDKRGNDPATESGKVDSMWTFLGIWNEDIATIFGAVIMWVERIVLIFICCKVFKSSCGRRSRRRGVWESIEVDNASIRGGRDVVSQASDFRESIF